MPGTFAPAGSHIAHQDYDFSHRKIMPDHAQSWPGVSLAAGYDHSKSGDRVLPVRRYESRIVEKVKSNRVTLILADTGSGKSSQVPQMLLEAGMRPILCTQPRRLAVVAVAKRVAVERGCTLGGEIGYQIGQRNASTTRSSIVFKTAGVLFEDMRANGAAAVTKFKVVILDEVHERSVESDLVLTCIKQLMIQSSSLRLVLMSATADFRRFEEFFKDIESGERVEKIAIPNLASSLRSTVLNTKVHYLETVLKILGNSPRYQCMLNESSAMNFIPERGTDVDDRLQQLICDLVLDLHQTEPNVTKSILIFLPTYRALEKQWSLLKATGKLFKLYVLHSSIDMEHSMQAMEVQHSNRKIILATNVAESSVTMPGVSFVIDSCLSLELFWDCGIRRNTPRLVWVSESQANQRKGRTGRTCDGVVFRMVLRSQFLQFKKFETPAMQLLSLRKQVLMILCASSKALNDPAALLKKCMNPPPPNIVPDAFEALHSMQAIEHREDSREKYKPTLYGGLLVALPLSLEASKLLVIGGAEGYLRQTAILAAIMDTTPVPIVKPFGNALLYHQNLEKYYKSPGIAPSRKTPSKSSIMLANLCAFEFWERAFKDKKCWEDLIRQAQGSSGFIPVQRRLDEEEEWCTQHHVSLTSLHAISEMTDVIMETLHQFRPSFLKKNVETQSHFKARNFHHECILLHSVNEIYEENDNAVDACQATCLSCPYVGSGALRSLEEEQTLDSLIFEAQRDEQEPFSAEESAASNLGGQPLTSSPLCSYFMKGLCTRGSNCQFSHSKSAKLMPCRFFMSKNGCRYGSSCRYSHDETTRLDLAVGKDPISFLESGDSLLSIYNLLPGLRGTEYLLLFGEGNFSFSEHLAGFVDPRKIIATTLDDKNILQDKDKQSISQRVCHLQELGMQIHWNVDATQLVSLTNKGNSTSSIPWKRVRCLLWNFPFADVDEHAEEHKILMVRFFESASIKLIASGLKALLVPVIITLCNDQFCRWQVQRAARKFFFYLKTSGPFDPCNFGGYRPVRNNLQESFPMEKPHIYVFELRPPVGLKGRPPLT